MSRANEILRKSLHIAFGLFAISLKWVPWWFAAAVCAAAIIGNWLLLDRLFGSRVSRDARGYDAGVLIYPLVVSLLIIIFRERLDIAGTAWAILAFGDGFATIAGKTIRGPRLPWNGDKSISGFVAFILFGMAGAIPVSYFLGEETPFAPRWAIVTVAVVLAAITESLALRIDDNISVPFASAVTMAIAMTSTAPALQLDRTTMIWLAVNTVAAIAGYALRTVSVSGFIAGWALGATILVFGHWRLYIALLVFFVLGTAATKLGYRRKQEAGLAQEGEGKRGFGHAFANVGVAAICAVAIAFARGDAVLALWCATVAALATAGADSVATEIGQLIGSRTFLPLTLRPVPRGTEGAISLEGTMAGAVAAVVIAATGILPLTPVLGLREVLLVALCAVAASYVESLAGNWNRHRDARIPNGVLNFFNTAVGAGLALLFLP